MSRLLALILILAAFAARAPGQVYGPPSPEQQLLNQADTIVPPISAPGILDQTEPTLNPLTVLDGAAQLFGPTGARGGTGPASAEADPEAPGLSAAVNIMVLLTVITLVPSVMLMTTCFLRILVVLALLKQALGTQSIPPSQVISGLALFMTILVMTPTVERIWTEAVVPYQNGEIRDYDTLWQRSSQPVRDFMFDQLEATGNWTSLYMVLNYRGVDTSEPQNLTRADVDMVSLVPAYMLSELKVAFVMGFRVYLPFLVIDMVIASLLISMSMMMLPPVLISLPFKLMLFVLVDGWTLIVSSLLTSFERGSGRFSAVATDAVNPSLLLAPLSLMTGGPPHG